MNNLGFYLKDGKLTEIESEKDVREDDSVKHIWPSRRIGKSVTTIIMFLKEARKAGASHEEIERIGKRYNLDRTYPSWRSVIK